MNRRLCIAAFIVGAAVIAWIGAGYLGTHLLALAVTAIIGVTYLAGAIEMFRFQRANAALLRCLSAIPADLQRLDDWLATLPAGLRDPVRLRVEGERYALPGPVLTPYLLGLLVMLGMLGTFLGLVVTLNGAVLALEGTTDLQAIRASLAAPVKGLGLAFGTSVAGVAASAMLGLMSALCRRERFLASQVLDQRIATALRAFSLAHQRQESFRALQAQSQSLPELVGTLRAAMAQMAERHEAMNERLLNAQHLFHGEIKEAYGALARELDRSLQTSLRESARLAGATIEPAVTATMAAIRSEALSAHERMVASVSGYVDKLAARIDNAFGNVASACAEAVGRQEHCNQALSSSLEKSLLAFGESFEQRAGALLERVGAAQESMLSAQAAHDERRGAALTQSLAEVASALRGEWQTAGAQTLAYQQEICRTLEATAQELAGKAQMQAERTIAEVARMVQVAAETPRLAADVIAQMRDQYADSIRRDNAMLEERARLTDSLAALIENAGEAAERQRALVEKMTSAATATLDRAGQELSSRTAQDAERLDALATQLSVSAMEVGSLAEALGSSVDRFGDANAALAASLARMESALEKSAQRSDDQLAYYVAQARELIDLCVLSQQRLTEALRQQLAVAAAESASPLAEVC